MFTLSTGRVIEVRDWDQSVQELTVNLDKPAETRQALNYLAFLDRAQIGDKVLLNTTAHTLSLGTGGWDFVVANLELRVPSDTVDQGHIIKARYLPCQHSVHALEEQPEYKDIWERSLKGFPVLIGQVHSQIAGAAAGLSLSGLNRIAYIMTDGAALPMGFSRLVRDLAHSGLIATTITCGQAFGGHYETVTLHSALLAAKYITGCEAAIVCQGPGNAGTGTKYGFSGINQAQHLDVVKALGGTPVAIVRMSGSDERERHLGISHHTVTALDLTYCRCIVAVPLGTDINLLPRGHDIRDVDNTWEAVELLKKHKINVLTMGRTLDDDPIFFQAAAAAGMILDKADQSNAD